MSSDKWVLILYVAGTSAASQAALANITAISEENIKNKYSLEVIDLRERPELAERDQIFGVPTLVRRYPEPLRKLIGDLSNHQKVMAWLDIRPAGKT